MNKFFILKANLAIVAIAVSSCVTHPSTERGYLTDALDNSNWDSSEWISVVDAPVVEGLVVDGTRAADGANWFGTTIRNEQKVVSAIWMTTALGVYDLYVNGKIIGEEILKPGFTHFSKTRRSFTYDITAAFNSKKGAENTISAQVTPGWWADKIITYSGKDGMIGRKCAFRSVLKLSYADGTSKLVGTDADTWKAGIAGKVKHADIFDGEIFDQREVPGYDCVSNFPNAEVNDEFSGEIVPTDGAEVYFREDIALQPVKAYVWNGVSGNSEDQYGTVKIAREYANGEVMTIYPNETLVVDFGQNCSAVPTFAFKSKRGTKLHCAPGELLNDGNGAKNRGMDGPEGSVHRRNLRIPETGMYLDYIFAEDGIVEHFCPRNTFFGYRFVSITASDEVSIEKIQSIPVSSITKEMEIGTIKTGNELINKLISNTIWGQRSNYLSVPTDCPQRNERLGWTADTQVFTETGSFFANTVGFFHKWMRDMRDTQSEEGGYPGVAPLAQYGAENSSMMRLGWADAGVIVPWTIWKQFGDTQIIEESWISMEKYIDHVNQTQYDHNTLRQENGNYQWADWLSYEPLESCGGGAFGANGPLPESVEYWSYLSASYWIMDAGMMRDMAKATGRDYQKFEIMEQEAKQYVIDRFFTSDGLFKNEILNTMQTPALFALKNRIVSGAAKEHMIDRLKENFKKHDNCLQTGFLGTSILMSTLTENGMSDIAYELLFQRKNPSWLYSIDNGATTIWERWNSYTIENGMGPSGMNSFNHYAYGCVCDWIWNTVAGISSDTSRPGFNHIIMKPIPDKRLGYVDAEYKSAAGIIKSSWRYEGDTWTWEFSIPEGATASITMPGESSAKEYTSGTYTLTAALNH